MAIKKVEYLLKHNLPIQTAYRFGFSFLLRLIGVFIKTDDSLVLLNSFGGRAYNDSPKVLFESMVQDPRFKNHKYIWGFEEPKKFSIENAETLCINSPRYFTTALKAKIWISNANIERGLHFKKKDTVYLNTWHGTGPKTGGNAVKGRKDYDFSDVDILCCDGEHSKTHYIRDFNALEKNMILSGRPREDALYRLTSEQIETYRERLDIPKDRKVILYAPTWREETNSGRSKPVGVPIQIEKWRSELQDEYIILFKAHLLTDRIPGFRFDSFFRDCSGYPDINHLYAVSDVLISDYSSVFSDFAILEKPIICFAYDYDAFVRSRGIYPEYYEGFPGGVLKEESEVIERIKHMDYPGECRKTAGFKNRLLSRGTNATEMCIAELARKTQRN